MPMSRPAGAGESAARYPLTMTNGQASRQAFNRADEIRLTYDGYRVEGAGEPVRGGFLPAPAAPAAAEPASPGEPKTSKRKP